MTFRPYAAELAARPLVSSLTWYAGSVDLELSGGAGLGLGVEVSPELVLSRTLEWYVGGSGPVDAVGFPDVVLPYPSPPAVRAAASTVVAAWRALDLGSPPWPSPPRPAVVASPFDAAVRPLAAAYRDELTSLPGVTGAQWSPDLSYTLGLSGGARVELSVAVSGPVFTPGVTWLLGSLREPARVLPARVTAEEAFEDAVAAVRELDLSVPPVPSSLPPLPAGDPVVRTVPLPSGALVQLRSGPWCWSESGVLSPLRGGESELLAGDDLDAVLPVVLSARLDPRWTVEP